jgi:arylsulfatase A-like enzyme
VGRAITGQFLVSIKTGRVKLRPRDLRRMVATYEGDVTYNDYQLGRLLEALRGHGVLDKTLVVFASDHGDEHMEHGSVGHGHTLYDELTRVPLVMTSPGVLPAGARVETDVESVDVMPTALDLAGVKPMSAQQGASLSPLVFADGPAMARPAFASAGAAMRSMRIGRYKYVLHHGDNEEIYEIAPDPYEKTNLKGKLPVANRYLRDVMSFWLAYEKRWDKATWGLPNNHAASFVEAMGQGK